MAGRALVDGHAVGLGKTGNETWARNVLLELEGSAHASQFVHLLTAEGLAALAGRVDPRRVRRVSRSSLVRLTIDLPRTLRELRPEALLVQYTRPLMTRVPTVVAVHDLSFHDARAAEWIPAATLLRYRRSVDASVRRAKRVITPSEHARSAVQQHYGLSGDQVLVAPLAVDPDFLLSLAAAERHQPADHYRVLMVGTVLPRKNVSVVARAVERLRAGGEDVRLRLVGPTPEAGRRELDLARRLLGAALEVRGAVSPDELASEYASAHVLAFPSYYEGFGIPLLEAMAAGTPVVSSDATCLPEVAGHAAQLVAPDDQSGWVAALGRALEAPQPWQVRGAARAAEFSWSRTAEVVRRAMAEATAV